LSDEQIHRELDGLLRIEREPRGRDSPAENVQSPATVGAIPHSTAEQHSPGNNRRKQQQAGPLQVREQKDEIDFSQHQSNSIQDEALLDEAWSVPASCAPAPAQKHEEQRECGGDDEVAEQENGPPAVGLSVLDLREQRIHESSRGETYFQSAARSGEGVVARA